MRRAAVICHDLNPQTFSFGDKLRLITNEEFVVFNEGTVSQPASDLKLAEFVDANPNRQLFLARAAYPVRAEAPDLRLRSVIPIVHPVLQMMRRIEQRVKQQQQSLRAEAVTQAATEFVAARLRTARQSLTPPINLHVNFLSYRKAHDIAEGDIDRVVDDMVGNEALSFIPADFPNLAIVTLITALVRGALSTFRYPAGQVDASNGILASLSHWQANMPPAVFKRVCALNMPDLVFFDAVYQRRNDGADEQVRTVLDAAAEITGHRVKRALHIARPAPAAGPGASDNGRVIPDPILGFRLRPNLTTVRLANDAQIAMHTDAEGYRVVTGQPQTGKRVFSAYGCSFTFGGGVADNETFCSVFQTLVPAWRIENYGVGSYCQTQNLVQLERNLQWNPCDIVAFFWISDHLRRNVAEASYVVRQFTGSPRSPISVWPRAVLDEEGKVKIKTVPFRRPDLVDVDLSDFEYDAYYRDLVCFGLLKNAAQLVHKHGGYFHIVLLRGQFSQTLRRLVEEAKIPFLDASLDGPEYSIPGDGHPNTLAHQVYAERLHEHFAVTSKLKQATPDRRTQAALE